MDFVVKEFTLLYYFWLSLGAFGTLIGPFIQNKVVLSGARNETFTCASSPDPTYISWSLFPVGGSSRHVEYMSVAYDDFAIYIKPNSKECRLFVNTANTSTAGVYNCYESPVRMASAQFIVITEEPACPTPNENLPCGKILQLTCTVKYSANASYVVANMKWSTGHSSESLNSSMETSTSANITTATSTLNVTRSHGSKSIPIYKCNTTFSLMDNLPEGFAKNEPDYSKICSPGPATYGPVGCAGAASKSGGLTGKGGKSTEKPGGKPGGKSTEKPGGKPGGKSGEKPGGKPGEKSGEKSGKKSDEKSDKSSGGLSFGSNERNIIKSVVGIAGVLLIAIENGV